MKNMMFHCYVKFPDSMLSFSKTNPKPLQGHVDLPNVHHWSHDFLQMAFKFTSSGHKPLGGFSKILPMENHHIFLWLSHIFPTLSKDTEMPIGPMAMKLCKF